MTDSSSGARLNKASLLVRSQPLFTPKVLDTIEVMARDVGLDRNDFAELMMLSEIGDLLGTGLGRTVEDRGDVVQSELAREAAEARMVLSRFVSRDTLAVPRTDRRRRPTYAGELPANQARALIDNANVLALRMAHSQPLSERVPKPGGYPRSGLGMNLHMPAEKVWEHSRGYWRVRPDADYILPTRLGYAPFLFKVEDWRTSSDSEDAADRSARYWAQRGWLVDWQNARLLPMDGSPPREPSDTDLALGKLLSDRVLRYPLGLRNPAVWIGRRN